MNEPGSNIGHQPGILDAEIDDVSPNLLPLFESDELDGE